MAEAAIQTPRCNQGPVLILCLMRYSLMNSSAAGMLIMAGGGNGKPLDYDELERWTRVGYERGTRSRNGER
jgi:hypothetical protein